MAALTLLGLAPNGCKLTSAEKVAAVPKSCPDGAELKGAPPPEGAEIWCEKIVGGVPVKDGAFVAYNFSGNRMICLLYTSPSPRDLSTSRMPSSA